MHTHMYVMKNEAITLKKTKQEGLERGKGMGEMI